MEIQNASGVSRGMGNIVRPHNMFLMTGEMPADNNVIFNMDNTDTFKSVFEEQIVGDIYITLTWTYDTPNMKSIIYMPADSKDVVQKRKGNITWVMFEWYKDKNKFFCTNKVGKWGDDTAMVLFDDVDDIAVGLTRALKAISLEVQDVMPAQETSGEG